MFEQSAACFACQRIQGIIAPFPWLAIGFPLCAMHEVSWSVLHQDVGPFSEGLADALLHREGCQFIYLRATDISLPLFTIS